MAATRASTSGRTLVCIAVRKNTVWTPMASPVTTAAAVTPASGTPSPRASASAVMTGIRQATASPGRAGGRIRPAPNCPPTAPRARLALITPQAAAPPRYRWARAGPSTVTGASVSMENTSHCPVSSHSHRIRTNSPHPTRSAPRRLTTRVASVACATPAHRLPAAAASRTAWTAKPAPGPSTATTRPARAGAAIAAVEAAPPSRALAGASRSRGTRSGISAVLAGPKNPSAHP